MCQSRTQTELLREDAALGPGLARMTIHLLGLGKLCSLPAGAVHWERALQSSKAAVGGGHQAVEKQRRWEKTLTESSLWVQRSNCIEKGIDQVWAYYRFPWWERLESCGFSNRGDNSCANCKSVATVWVQCPGCTWRAESCVQWSIWAGWAWDLQQCQNEAEVWAAGDGHQHLLVWPGV